MVDIRRSGGCHLDREHEHCARWQQEVVPHEWRDHTDVQLHESHLRTTRPRGCLPCHRTLTLLSCQQWRHDYNYYNNELLQLLQNLITINTTIITITNDYNYYNRKIAMHLVPFQVSRCGMIYMDPQSMGWRPLFTSWLSTLPKTFSEGLIIKITSFFERYVDTCLKFVRNEVRVIYLFRMENKLVESLKLMFLFYFATYHNCSLNFQGTVSN